MIRTEIHNNDALLNLHTLLPAQLRHVKQAKPLNTLEFKAKQSIDAFKVLNHEIPKTSKTDIVSTLEISAIGTQDERDKAPQSTKDIKAPVIKDEDQLLISAFQCGDHKAFNTLVNKYDRKIRNMVSRIIFQKEDVEDIMQEAWLSVFNGLQRFRGDAQFYSWLYRIAQNTAISAVKKEIRKKKTFETSATEHIDDHNAFNNNSPLNLTNQEYTPEEVLLSEQLTHHFEHGLALLSNEVRETFVYREQHGLSYQDIASIQDIPIGTVRSRIARARDVIANQPSLQGIDLQPS